MKSIFQHFIPSNLVGSGPFAGCWDVMDKETGDFHYLRSIDRNTLNTPEKLSDFSSEVSLFSAFHHRMLPPLVEFMNDDDSFYVVFEKEKNLSLYDAVQKNGRFNENQTRLFLNSLIEVIHYLNEQVAMTNWTISFETIFVNDDGSISQIYPIPTNSVLLKTSEFAEVRTKAPEQITLKKEYDEKCLSWFIGVTVYLLAVGCYPFNGKSVESIKENILRAHPVIPDSVSKPLSDLISKLLIKNPQMRLSFKRIKEHPFVSGSDINFYGNRNPIPRAFSQLNDLNKAGLMKHSHSISTIAKSKNALNMQNLGMEQEVDINSDSDSNNGENIHLYSSKQNSFSNLIRPVPKPTIGLFKNPSCERISITPKRYVSKLQSRAMARVFNTAKPDSI